MSSIECLAVLISVPESVAHLAGAARVAEHAAGDALASDEALVPAGQGVGRGRVLRVALQRHVQEHVEHLHMS